MRKELENSNVVIELRNIVKKFGSFIANDGINIKLRQGEIHAILGENGAGKTTLMNQIYGLIKPTSGKIFVRGKEVNFNDSNDAIRKGIGMVHQHFMLIEPFTVVENIILGMEPMKNIIVDMKEARKKVIELSDRYGLQIDPDEKIKNISVGMQQRVEILKALYRNSDILIFDEPTASLTPQEIDEFLNIIKKMALNGKSILIITHKLKEIKKVCDVCSIIRGGKYITTVDVEKVSEEELAELMVGRKITFEVEKDKIENDDVVLDIKNLKAKDYRNIDVLKGINLNIKKGEIVGLAGIDGNGQTELVNVITGMMKATEGEVTLNGKNILNKTPKFVFDNGVSCIPADRQKYGLILDLSVEDNMILHNYNENKFSNNGIMKRKSIKKFAKDNIKKYDIRPNDCESKKVANLSGGNQQKVIIAREIENNKDLLIAFNPTRGLDVGAIEYIHKFIIEQRNKNKAILLVSFELDEIMSLSDRIEVIFNGKIKASLNPKVVTENDIGLMMAGGENG